MQEQPLFGKLALVTGASGLIGSAIATRLAADGAMVIAHYNSDAQGAEETVRGIESAGGKAAALRADLSLKDGPSDLFTRLDASFGGAYAGRLDILVNNAGIFDAAEIGSITDEMFDRLFMVNVRAMFQLSREASRRMAVGKWGRIVNIGSVFGEASFGPGLSLYSASKFAVRGLTQGWSRDLGPSGITVNNVQPALIQKEPAPTEGAAYEAMEARTSVGRFGRASEVADAVAFLASPQSGFINGTSLAVDGGWNA